MSTLQVHRTAVLGKRPGEETVVRRKRSGLVDDGTCVGTENDIKRPVVFDIALYDAPAHVIDSRSVTGGRIGDYERPVIDDLATLNRVLLQRNRDILARGLKNLYQ